MKVLTKVLILSALGLISFHGLVEAEDVNQSASAVQKIASQLPNGNSVILHVRSEEERLAAATTLAPGETIITKSTAEVNPVKVESHQSLMGADSELEKDTSRENKGDQQSFSEGQVLASESAYDVVQMSVRSHGQEVYGEMYKPKKEGKVPLIIMSHRLGANHESLKDYAEALVKDGNAVYVYDFRGGSKDSKSAAFIKHMSFNSEIEDLEAVLRSSKHLKYIDNKSITLFGDSFGALVTSAVAKRHDDDVKNMILLSPSFNLPVLMQERFVIEKNIPESFFMNDNLEVSAFFAKDLWNYNPYKEIQKFDKDVLIVYGDKDEEVPSKYLESLGTLVKRGQLKIVKDGGHEFKDSSFTQALNYIREFLKDSN